MSRPTDRQLLEDVHARVCNPVLFPALEPTPERAGILIPGHRHVAYIPTGRPDGLLLEFDVFDRISFVYRWVFPGTTYRSRDFFAQLGPAPPLDA